MPKPENVIGKGNRWKKGESGNPKGRPRERVLKDLLMDYFDDAKVKAIFAALDKKAKAGDVRAITEVLDRLVGKPTQTNQSQLLDEHGNPTNPTNTIIIKKPE